MEASVEKPHRIAGYCRISVDVEADRDNTSIENQKDIISDYVQRYFPDREIQSKCIKWRFLCFCQLFTSAIRRSFAHAGVFLRQKNGLNPLTAC